MKTSKKLNVLYRVSDLIVLDCTTECANTKWHEKPQSVTTQYLQTSTYERGPANIGENGVARRKTSISNLKYSSTDISLIISAAFLLTYIKSLQISQNLLNMRVQRLPLHRNCFPNNMQHRNSALLCSTPIREEGDGPCLTSTVTSIQSILFYAR